MASKKVNFSAMERELILQFVEENKGVLENKSGDVLSVKRRREKWQELEGLFLDSGFKRDWRQLRNAYQKMKVHAKQAISGFAKRGEDDISPVNNPSGEDWRIMEITPEDFKISEELKVVPSAALLEPVVQVSSLNLLKKKRKNPYEEKATKLDPELIKHKLEHDNEMYEIKKNHTLLRNELEITKMKLDLDIAQLQKEKLELEIAQLQKEKLELKIISLTKDQ